MSTAEVPNVDLMSNLTSRITDLEKKLMNQEEALEKHISRKEKCESAENISEEVIRIIENNWNRYKEYILEMEERYNKLLSNKVDISEYVNNKAKRNNEFNVEHNKLERLIEEARGVVMGRADVSPLNNECKESVEHVPEVSEAPQSALESAPTPITRIVPLTPGFPLSQDNHQIPHLPELDIKRIIEEVESKIEHKADLCQVDAIWNKLQILEEEVLGGLETDNLDPRIIGELENAELEEVEQVSEHGDQYVCQQPPNNMRQTEGHDTILGEGEDIGNKPHRTIKIGGVGTPGSIFSPADSFSPSPAFSPKEPTNIRGQLLVRIPSTIAKQEREKSLHNNNIFHDGNKVGRISRIAGTQKIYIHKLLSYVKQKMGMLDNKQVQFELSLENIRCAVEKSDFFEMDKPDHSILENIEKRVIEGSSPKHRESYSIPQSNSGSIKRDIRIDELYAKIGKVDTRIRKIEDSYAFVKDHHERIMNHLKENEKVMNTISHKFQRFLALEKSYDVTAQRVNAHEKRIFKLTESFNEIAKQIHEIEIKSNQVVRMTTKESLSSQKLYQIQEMVEALQNEYIQLKLETTRISGPLYQEFTKLRNENQILMKELERNQQIYRNLLTEHYKAIQLSQDTISNMESMQKEREILEKELKSSSINTSFSGIERLGTASLGLPLTDTAKEKRSIRFDFKGGKAQKHSIEHTGYTSEKARTPMPPALRPHSEASQRRSDIRRGKGYTQNPHIYKPGDILQGSHTPQPNLASHTIGLPMNKRVVRSGRKSGGYTRKENLSLNESLRYKTHSVNESINKSIVTTLDNENASLISSAAHSPATKGEYRSLSPDKKKDDKSDKKSFHEVELQTSQTSEGGGEGVLVDKKRLTLNRFTYLLEEITKPNFPRIPPYKH